MATMEPTATLITRWREDDNATYRSWFLWDQRLKNFRSIRRGLAAVVREIEAGTFGNQYRGSSLEVVVHSVAEQRQIFKGADHAFLWKPKLRIPDIYENADNQRIEPLRTDLAGRVSIKAVTNECPRIAADQEVQQEWVIFSRRQRACQGHQHGSNSQSWVQLRPGQRAGNALENNYPCNGRCPGAVCQPGPGIERVDTNETWWKRSSIGVDHIISDAYTVQPGPILRQNASGRGIQTTGICRAGHHTSGKGRRYCR